MREDVKAQAGWLIEAKISNAFGDLVWPHLSLPMRRAACTVIGSTFNIKTTYTLKAKQNLTKG